MRVRGAGRAKPAPVFTPPSPVLLESTAQLEPTHTNTHTHSIRAYHTLTETLIDTH